MNFSYIYSMNTPLAERMRPKSLGEYFGQDHLVGPKGSLTQMISNGVFPSLIFWGPPGTGKTTLAQLLALEKERPFYQLSAINAGVKEIREIIKPVGLSPMKSKGIYGLSKILIEKHHGKVPQNFKDLEALP